MPELSPTLYQPARRCPLQVRLLVIIAICVLPAAAAVTTSRSQIGALWIYGTALGFSGLYALKGDKHAVSAILVACIPLLMLLRNFVYFSALNVVLAASVALWFVKSAREFGSAVLWVFLGTAGLYWWASFINTGVYSSNLRILEMVFAAANVYLLGKTRRSYLATALLGVWLSVMAIASSLLPYGVRLGMANIGDVLLGNPMTFGASACLILLVSFTERGQWLLLAERPFARLTVILSSAACVLLSTARGSWLIAVCGLLTMWVFGRGQRKHFVIWAIPLALATILLLHSGRGAVITKYFSKMASSDRSMAERTTGRSVQYAVFPQILSDSPVYGHGPGSGIETHVAYTGTLLAWHSLYLLVGVETGLIGLTILTASLFWLLLKGMRHARGTRELVPLVGAVSFTVIGITVSGLDAASGMFLGLAMLGNEFGNSLVAAPLRTRMQRQISRPQLTGA